MSNDAFSTELSVRERVFKICNQLYAENTRVKIRTVLSLLPDVKSTSTVHKYHKEWRTDLENSKKTLFDSFGFSDAFQNAFVTEIARFHTDAKNEYSEKLVELTEERDSAVLGLEKADGEIIALQDKNNELNELVRELQNEISLITRDAKQQVERLEKDKSAATDRLERQMTDLESRLNNEKKALAEQLQNQIDSVTLKNNELREISEQQRTELAKAQLKLESNNALVVEIKDRAKSSEEEAKSKISKLEESLSALSIEHNQTAQALAVAKEKILSKDDLVVSSLNQYEIAIKNESSLRLMVEEKDREQRELRTKLERVIKDDESAQAELLRLTEKMGEIKHVLVLRERELAELKNSMKAKK
jgi:chromosome segregation ATPase